MYDIVVLTYMCIIFKFIFFVSSMNFYLFGQNQFESGKDSRFSLVIPRLDICLYTPLAPKGPYIVYRAVKPY